VLWLTGVDYFSTLGYQPGLALLAANALSPLATAILVLVTLFGALPIYGEVARRSFGGEGSISMLEKLLPGWRSKLFVLVLLGFASTDFVITMTLSASDAAQHAVENPLLRPIVGHGVAAQVWISLGLLALLAAVFLKGFTEAIGLAVGVGIPYIVLNAVVIVRGAMEIGAHPEALQGWQTALTAQPGGSLGILWASVLVFPQLALGLSGFETGVSVMPLVKGDPGEEHAEVPHGRVRNTRKLLLAAAVLMSVLLIASSFVTALLIPKQAYEEHGAASGRALAYLAHELLGQGFGTVYDISTILILWFAGSSAMAGMLNIIPRYLPRYGMAPTWVAHTRPLVLLLFAVDVVVTVVFRANVEHQGGAYATGVLVLMLSAAVAVTLALSREAREGTGSWARAIYFGGVTLVFGYTLIANIIKRHDGVLIASGFIFCILAASALSRWMRSTELRVESVEFSDHDSAEHWDAIRGKKVNIVPLKQAGRSAIPRKTREIRTHYRVQGPLAFIHVDLEQDRSDFASRLRIRVSREGEGDYFVEVFGAVAIANALAYVSELIDPISIFLGLTRQNSVDRALRYLLWGEGETGILLYEILRQHWDRTPEEDVRPLIFLMSD
jgi:hypothetical protein